MDEEKEPATEAIVPTIAPEEDSEARVAALEAEKAKLIEEGANYKVAYLKEKAKNDEPADEEEDAKMRRIANEAVANSRIAEIAREQDAIITRALKENKELKLAQLNKKEPPAAMGGHNEGIPVRDTLVTPEQLDAFKARGWSEKDIERYKKNLQKYAGR